MKENKESKCIICGKNKCEELDNMQPFIFVNSNNINNSSIFNILLSKYKEIYTYDCECRKNNNEDVLCVKLKYNIVSYPIFIFILFDFQYSDLVKNKNNIFKLIGDNIILNIKAEYRIVGIICAPTINHFSTIIFNPIGSTINSNFGSNYIYYHDGTLNNGKINVLKESEDWRNIGIPYIVLYKKIED